MASLERDRPDGPFQIGFRLGDARFKRSAKTKSQCEADEHLARVGRKLRLVD